MKKYLLAVLALFSVATMANDDFKASVTVGYGTTDSIYGKKDSLSLYLKVLVIRMFI